MTFIGKMLIVVQLVLSPLFMPFAGAVFTVEHNWKQHYSDKHQNPIGIPHRRKPMSNHQYRPVSHQLIERLLYTLFTFGIERGGRLVQ